MPKKLEEKIVTLVLPSVGLLGLEQEIDREIDTQHQDIDLQLKLTML